ncbi:MAG: asparagine synthetase B [Candidatus Diapherotrites archaeon]|uniref:Putative asparagine synthetase [glutamine-hydrolyzing] n=1 Tax=Candidatus Iainarchaeum sp. TaxID=3101447 RepID=A0A8T3YLI0_9ARCH|nr:asparagine synthetase B [Candidatus Diapherotrites archaeon]
MCSVIGVCSRNGEDVSHDAIELMSVLRHRGPEAFGVKCRGREVKSRSLNELKVPATDVVLGHCLLSTTGYGVQPISAGNVSIAHNGQIYNYEELNASLGFGQPVSDSEVIARFFSSRLEKSGAGFLSALKEFSRRTEGEYAVGALLGKKLFAFRDFLGQKPLWFGSSDSVLAFASEPAALMKIGIQFPQPLPPGHLLEISRFRMKASEAYTLTDFRKTVPKKHSMNALHAAFGHAVSMQCAGLGRAAVLFSGGVDSSLIAKAVSGLVPKTRLFVAGVDGSHDIESAESASEELGLPLEKILLSEKRVERLALRSAGMLSFFDVMQVALAVPELACAERISPQGFKVVFSGQGSDEIFCGYSSYADLLARSGQKAVGREIWSSLSRMWSRNFHRDDAILASQSLELRLPFMSRSFLREAMAFPAGEKMLSKDDRLRKHPVRGLARLCGIPESIASRPKKAMQYGSGTQKVVSKLFG